MRTRAPPHALGGVAHLEPTSHGSRPGPAHRILDAGPRPGRPIIILKFHGPARHGFEIIGPARLGRSRFQTTRPGPARPIIIFRSARPGPARLDPARNTGPRQTLQTWRKTLKVQLPPATQVRCQFLMTSTAPITYQCLFLHTSRATALRPRLSALSARAPDRSTETARRDCEITSCRGEIEVLHRIQRTH